MTTSITTATRTAPRSDIVTGTSTGAGTRARTPIRTVAAGGAYGSVLALAGAAAVLVVGNVGAPIRIITGWSPSGAELTMADVAVSTIVSVVLGAVLLGVLGRFSTRAFAIWVALASVVTVLSFVPLWGLDVDAGSKVALTVMHVVVGAAAILGQWVARRPAR